MAKLHDPSRCAYCGGLGDVHLNGQGIKCRECNGAGEVCTICRQTAEACAECECNGAAYKASSPTHEQE